LLPELREFDAASSLLFRPVAQIALFHAIGLCTKLGMPAELAVARMNRVRWRASHSMWEDVIVRSNGRMITTKDAIRLTARFVAYLVAADHMTDGAIETLRSNYVFARGVKSGSNGTLPRSLAN
jgi:hypothetical protein